MSRLKKILKWMALSAIALIAILLIVNAVLNWIASSRLEERLSKLREAGEPVTLADLERDPIPPEENAAAILRRAEKDIAAIEKELNATVYQSKSYRDGQLTDEDQQSVEAALDAYPDAVRLIRQAADCRDYDPQLDYTSGHHQFLTSLTEHVQQSRGASRIMQAQIRLSLAEGNREEALADCVRLFRLARLTDREPMLIGYLVALAIRGAACDEMNRVLLDGPVSDQARQALDNELAAHEPMDGFLHALTTERALGNASFRDMIGDGLRSFVLWHFKNQQSNYLDRMAREIELGPRPLHEIDDRLTELKSQAADAGMLVSLFDAPLDAARQAVDRVRANMRCLRVLNALQRRSGHAGDDQIDLDDLALPKTAKTDPFTGDPLIVHKSAKGWTVYSVGSNLKDDGGKLDPAHDVGAGINLAPDGEDQ